MTDSSVPQTITSFSAWVTAVVPIFLWPTLVILAWRVSKFVAKVETTVTGALTTLGSIYTLLSSLSTNHVPHIQESLDRIEQSLHRLDRLADRLENQ